MRLAQLRAVFLDPAIQLSATHLWHFEIAHNEIVFIGKYLVHGHAPVAGSVYLHRERLKNFDKEIQNIFLVVDHQNAFAADEIFKLQRLGHQFRGKAGFVLQAGNMRKLNNKSGSLSQDGCARKCCPRAL